MAFLKLIMFYLDLEFFLLLLQGIFKFDEFLCVRKTKISLVSLGQKVTAAFHKEKHKFKKEPKNQTP